MTITMVPLRRGERTRDTGQPIVAPHRVASVGDERLRFSAGVAERLPCPGGSFDLVVSTTSFDH